MKQFAALILLCLALTACAPAPIPDFTDLYQITETVIPIHTANQTGHIAIPAKFNPATGTMTPLCSDPVCSHGLDSDCPFAEVDASGKLNYMDGRFYFDARRIDEPAGAKTLMCYDLSTMQTTEILRDDELYRHRPEGAATRGMRRAFCLGYLWYGELGQQGEMVYSLRVELPTGKLEVLDPAAPWPAHRYGEQYIFPEGTAHFYDRISIGDTIDGANRRTLVEGMPIALTFGDLLDDDILLYVVYADQTAPDLGMALHAYDLTQNTDRVLCAATGDINLAAVGDSLYYTMPVDDPPYLGVDQNSDKPRYNSSGGVVWQLNAKTGETSRAFSIPEYQLLDYSIEAVGQYILIDYENVDYTPVAGIEDPLHGETYYEYPRTVGRIVYDAISRETTVYPMGEKANASQTIHG